eukprot:GILJ01022017.1.p1 GENE.GILJ01022017.1~~GILJ01022017.1.p1  ORF type:complete len:919 (-),score=103.72 GILJ01022017.1:30-2786(-)
MVDGMSRTQMSKNENEATCEVCVMSKSTKATYPERNTEERDSVNLLDVVHTDVCGPVDTQALNGGAKYWILFKDQKSRAVVLYLMQHKSEAFDKMKEYEAMITNMTGKKIKAIQMDNGGEYSSREMTMWLKAKGIMINRTMPYTPQQNGIAERTNRVIQERVTAMLLDANLPKQFWGEAALCAVYLINRSPSRTLKDKTPIEVLTGKKPNLQHLRRFGCVAYVHIQLQQRHKLDVKAVASIMVGYETFGYRLWDSKNRRLLRSKNVIFNESKNAAKPVTMTEEKTDTGRQPYPPARSTININEDMNRDEDTVDNVPIQDMRVHQQPRREDEDLAAEDNPHEHHPIQVTQQEAAEIEEVVEQQVELEEHRRSGRKRVEPDYYTPGVYLTTISEPATYEEAIRVEDAAEWRNAMEEEFKSLQENETWKLVRLPEGQRKISNKWVYKVKLKKDGEVERYKARLVAKGFSQKEGIDYHDVYAPVAKHASIRLVFGICTQLKMYLHQMDVSSAFLYGNLEETIYMTQPKGFEVKGKEDYVCLLRKSLYGLKQAPRQWNHVIDSYMKQIGFARLESDHCIYQRRNQSNFAIVVIWVDDLIIAASTMDDMNNIKAALKQRFKVRDLDELNYCLGWEVKYKREEGIMTINQRKHFVDILRKFKFENAHPQATPLDCNVNLSKNSQNSTESETINREQEQGENYRCVVGSLMYAMLGTRPDICTALGIISRYQENPNNSHWTAAKRVLRYINGSKDIGLIYRRSGSQKIQMDGYVDADYANDIDDRKSVTGYVFNMNGTPISWSSKKQTTVASSTTEAEYIALSTASSEALWLRHVLSELQVCDMTMPTVLYTDSQGALAISKNPEHHSRAKHIDIKLHVIRERISSKQIEVKYVPTIDQKADILTKALPKPQFQRLRSLLNIDIID